MNSPASDPSGSATRRAGPGPGVLFNTAVEAFFQTWLIFLVGRFALGLVSGVFAQMVPSAPPGFTRTPLAENDGSIAALWDAGWFLLKSHRFLLLFIVIFGLTLWMRLTPRHSDGRFRPHSRARRALGRLSDNWFGLLVMNAFGAMIASMMFVWVQFSLEKWLLKEVLDWVFSGISGALRALFGDSGGGAFQRWWQWYGDNQLKFAFWVFFLGGILDDLGLPNFKTLGKLLWRRIRRAPAETAEAAPVLPAPGPEETPAGPRA